MLRKTITLEFSPLFFICIFQDFRWRDSDSLSRRQYDIIREASKEPVSLLQNFATRKNFHLAQYSFRITETCTLVDLKAWIHHTVELCILHSSNVLDVLTNEESFTWTDLQLQNYCKKQYWVSNILQFSLVLVRVICALYQGSTNQLLSVFKKKITGEIIHILIGNALIYLLPSYQFQH